jgi:hypothetical protein
MRMSDLRNYNEYLFHEFGYDNEDQAKRISDTWPFSFNHIGTFDIAGTKTEVFEFKDGKDDFYLVDGSSLTFYDKNGLEPKYIQMFLIGSQWIWENDPIDLNTSKLGETDIPNIPERRQKIEQLCLQHLSDGDCKILEGLFLKKKSQYVAIVRCNNDGKTAIVGDKIVVRKIPFQNLSPWKRISIGIGNLIVNGRL